MVREAIPKRKEVKRVKSKLSKKGRWVEMAGANEIRDRVGHKRIFTIPGTSPPEKAPISVVREEIVYPEDLEGFGPEDLYHFRAWLEEEIQDPGCFTIALEYWRKKDNKSTWKSAGKWSFRTDPFVIRFLFEEMVKRGWLERKGIHGERRR